MRFSDWLYFQEYGTQGMGPGASGARGAPPITGKVSQTTSPAEEIQQTKKNANIKGVPPSSMTPRGLGAPMQPPKAGISGGGKSLPQLSPSPFSLGIKSPQPQFSTFSSKNGWKPRSVGFMGK